MAAPLTQQKQPAPGQSPYGGTTSLPQHLQSQAQPAPTQPQPVSRPLTEGVAPGKNPLPYPNVAPPAQPAPSSTPAGTVPPAPPPPNMTPAPAPVSDPVGTIEPEDTRNKEMGDKLFQELMAMLGQGGRYGAEEASKTREQGIGRLQDERKLSEQRSIADAAKRGVYHGSPLTNSLGDIGERYNRGLGDLELGIEKDQAQRAMEDKQRAIEMIFGYGDRQRMDKEQQDSLWLKLMELGLLGGPTIPGAVGDMPTGV